MRDFLKQLITAKSGVSSKRVMAIIALVAVLFLAFFKYDNQTIMYMLGFVTAMMGLGTVDKFNSS
ncbi:MAG: hypothetical protein JXB49_24700 [Bacteroidales bacterium]|nr:hypothetical protein [Bacteroidales bacterium]